MMCSDATARNSLSGTASAEHSGLSVWRPEPARTRPYEGPTIVTLMNPMGTLINQGALNRAPGISRNPLECLVLRIRRLPDLSSRA